MWDYGFGLLGALVITDYTGLMIHRIGLGTYNLAVAALGFMSATAFRAGYE